MVAECAPSLTNTSSIDRSNTPTRDVSGSTSVYEIA
jgi:hypothetical protein